MPTSVRILIRAARQWSDNGDMRMGAALAYYALFSVAPLLVIAVNIAGLVYGPEAAQGEVKRQLSTYVDADTAGTIQNLVKNAGESQSSATAWAHAISLGVLVFGALGAFLHLRTSLCLIWRLEPPKGSTIVATVLDYGLALLMVFVTGILLLASVAASLTLSFVRAYMDERLPVGSFLWEWVEFAVSVAFLTLLFSAIYRVLSGRRIAWGYAGYGATVAALLFTVGKYLFSFYVVYAGPASAYGAAGSLVIFLVWVYYSSQTLFFGAELIQARRTRHEWLDGPPAV